MKRRGYWWYWILPLTALLTTPDALACDCANCQAAQAAAMQQALTQIDAQKPIPANSVTHVYKNVACENQLGNYGTMLDELDQLLGNVNGGSQIVQLLQTLFGSAQSACGSTGGTVGINATAVQWTALTNPSAVQTAINDAQGGAGNANFQNLFQ
ncbi:hypothetical protein F6A13_11885 [Acidithiobacillus sp. 'AMD consortium']|uniref:hypothetical protein n=1 Tax=Acidithiobacillus sp. 'AMD consortium' TaxID=2614801 RepID=UPI00124EFC96|nr:hypothetical protein [Acidithiobacillus sp. 'AMD consortium']QFG79235.1 hypothetical protein F6A13_11885 [Acidithiobacillus sp. 'AMD consortium']